MRRSSEALPGLWIVLAVTAARVALLAFDTTDLFVDEAQYWLWGEHLDFGYYSKPPLIGWVIRAFTEIGSDSAFWIRLPAPLFHAATALILGRLATDLYDPRAGLLVAAGYVTLPFVALGSLLISTDTIMAPFYCAALLFWFRLLVGGQSRHAWLAGAMVGLAFMGKYAGIYFLMTASLAALFLPAMRPRRGDALRMLAAFVVVIAPNVIWNLTHDLTTVSHTMDNVQWVREGEGGVHPGKLAEFFLDQFIVFGPVLFGALIWRALRPGPAPVPALIWLSWPILVLVCAQALLSKAYANWAVAAYFAGTVVVVPWLAVRSPGWLKASFWFNGALCVILPLLAIAPTALTTAEGRPLLSRYLDREATSQQLLRIAREEEVPMIVSDNRAILADLFHTGRESGIDFYAEPPQGRALHYYAQLFPLPSGVSGPALYVGREAPDCARRIGAIDTPNGAYRKEGLQIWRLDAAACLDALR